MDKKEDNNQHLPKKEKKKELVKLHLKKCFLNKYNY